LAKGGLAQKYSLTLIPAAAGSKTHTNTFPFFSDENVDRKNPFLKDHINTQEQMEIPATII
jgi:hypothetical protein